MSFDWSDFTISVVRYETKYPAEAPTCYVVGFNAVYNVNQRSKYIDMSVDYATTVNMNDQEIVDYAWSSLSSRFENWAKIVIDQSAILNSVFVPPS